MKQGYNYAAHCASCNDEIILSNHVLIPERESGGYTALCMKCASLWFVALIEGEEENVETGN